jgi:hypothetical protein
VWLLTIDEFVLERIFTPVASWIEWKTGKTNFYLAWWSIALAFLFFLVAFGMSWAVSNHVNFLDGIMVVWLSWAAYRLMKLAERQDEMVRRQPHQFVLREDSLFVRFVRVWLLVIMFWFFTIAMLLDRSLLHGSSGWAGVAVLFTTCSQYLMSVRRPPPRPRRETAPERNLAPMMT